MTSTELKPLKMLDTEEEKNICPECGAEKEDGVCPNCGATEETLEEDVNLSDEDEIE